MQYELVHYVDGPLLPPPPPPPEWGMDGLRVQAQACPDVHLLPCKRTAEPEGSVLPTYCPVGTWKQIYRHP